MIGLELQHSRGPADGEVVDCQRAPCRRRRVGHVQAAARGLCPGPRGHQRQAGSRRRPSQPDLSGAMAAAAPGLAGAGVSGGLGLELLSPSGSGTHYPCRVPLVVKEYLSVITYTSLL